MYAIMPHAPADAAGPDPDADYLFDCHATREAESAAAAAIQAAGGPPPDAEPSTTAEPPTEDTPERLRELLGLTRELAGIRKRMIAGLRAELAEERTAYSRAMEQANRALDVVSRRAAVAESERDQWRTRAGQAAKAHFAAYDRGRQSAQTDVRVAAALAVMFALAFVWSVFGGGD